MPQEDIRGFQSCTYPMEANYIFSIYFLPMHPNIRIYNIQSFHLYLHRMKPVIIFALAIILLAGIANLSCKLVAATPDYDDVDEREAADGPGARAADRITNWIDLNSFDLSKWDPSKYHYR